MELSTKIKYCLGLFLILLWSNNALADTAEFKPGEDFKLNETSGLKKGNVYINEECGFEITGPKDWLPAGPGTSRGDVIGFHGTNGSQQFLPYPQLRIRIDGISDISDVFDYARWILSEQQKMGMQYRLIEPIQEIEIDGVKGCKFALEEIMTKATFYIFRRCNLMVQIYVMDYSKDFQMHLNDFEEAIHSLKFKEPKCR